MIEDIHSKLQHDIQVDWYFIFKGGKEGKGTD